MLGARLLYRDGPFRDPEGTFMSDRLGVHPRAEARIAMMRLSANLNIEIFQYEAPDQQTEAPRVSDHGTHHIATQVDDMAAALERLRAVEGVEVLAGPTALDHGPSAGLQFIYFRTPWALVMEMIEAPASMPYEAQTDARMYDSPPAPEA